MAREGISGVESRILRHFYKLKAWDRVVGPYRRTMYAQLGQQRRGGAEPESDNWLLCKAILLLVCEIILFLQFLTNSPGVTACTRIINSRPPSTLPAYT